MIFRTYTTALIFSLLTSQAYADVWSYIAGIVTDPLGLEESSETIRDTVERAAIHAERLQGEIDADVRDYLFEIDRTVSETRDWLSNERDRTIEQTQTIISETLDTVSDLEKQLMADTSQLIKCSGEVTANTLRGLLADSLNDLGQRKPRFEVFGFTIGEVKIDAADIPSPIAGFRQTQALYERAILEVTESDPPSIITDSYAEIQRLAELARCHYKSDTAVYQELYLIELEYNRRGRAWHGRISPI